MVIFEDTKEAHDDKMTSPYNVIKQLTDFANPHSLNSVIIKISQHWYNSLSAPNFSSSRKLHIVINELTQHLYQH